MTLAAGTKFGSYQIVAPLGSGGMGEVYRARDAKLDRDVAIKVLPAHLSADADALSRFEREAKAVASLSHPNILAIHDFGTQDGVAYAVTELLEGETLRGKLDGAAIPQAQAVNWAQQVARGLSAAHGKGVIHRDLKPENVFVTKDGHVKILDFGLAKKAEQVSEQTNAPTGSGHTAPGTVMGTVGYMSPEQVRGLPVDHRSDIFSFGAILYELLSGRKAFKKDTATDTIASIIRDEPPELSQSGRSIPIALDHIVKRCLEKDRDNRFGTASDVAFALSEASGATSMVTSGAQTVAPVAGRKSWIWVAVAAAVVLAAAGLFLSRKGRSASPAAGGVKRVAVLPFENLGAPEDDYFADGIADQIRGKLAALPGIEVIARASSTPYKKTTKTPKQIADELNAQYLLTSTVRWQKSGTTSRVQVSPELVDVTHPDAPTTKWQQPFDANLTDVFQVQSDIASKVAQSLGVALGSGEEKRLAEKPTADLAAYDAFLKGEEASKGLSANDPPTLRKALAFYDQAVALDPSFAQAWARVAVECGLLYSNAKPTTELADRAKQAAEKAIALAPERPDSYLALSYYQRVVVHDARAAREACAKGLRFAPNDAALISATAAAEQAAGDWEAALQHARDAARLDPRSAVAVRRWGIVLLSLRRYPEAHEVFDRAIALTPTNVFANELKVIAFLAQGDLAGARSYLESASKRLEPTILVAFMAQNQDLVWVLDEKQTELLLRLTPEAFDGDRGIWGICRAQAYAFKSDSVNLRINAEEARKAFDEQLHQNAEDSQRRAGLGLALAYLGRKDEAIREGLRAVELSPVSKDAVNGAYVQHQLARIYILAGEPEKALDQLEPLLKTPYYLSPGWLKIDPNFDPVRNNPRFQKLVAGAK